MLDTLDFWSPSASVNGALSDDTQFFEELSLSQLTQGVAHSMVL